MALKSVFLVLVFSSALTSSLSVHSEVTVSPDCSNATTPSCIQVDRAFQTLTSNTTLYLKPGEHVLHMYHGLHLVGLHDVSIVGTDGGQVRITCDSDVGMTFINMSHLVLANIVIDSCGLSNIALRNATKTVKEFLDLNFVIPESVRIGLFIAHCTDLSISDSVVSNTAGLGLLGVNIIGNSSLKNVNFTRNIRPKCEKVPRSFPFYLQQDNFTSDQVGGGAYFLYQDSLDRNEVVKNSTFLISHCHFVQNAECTYAGYVNVNYRYYSIDGSPDLKYTIGGGGGLSIFMPQVSFTVSIDISNSDFISNDARYGAGAHIGFFTGSGVSTVLFSNCVFDSNGVPIQQEFGIANGGAAVAVFMDLLRQQGVTDYQSVGCSHINFTDTNFINNSATVEGGGVFAYSLSNNHFFYSYISFSRCLFQANVAKYGAGLYMSQRATQGADGTWGVFLNDVTVEGSRLPSIPAKSGKVSSSKLKCSAMELKSVLAIVEEGCLIIRDNKASGIHLTSSVISLSRHTSLILEGNRAPRGGGAYMDGNIPIIFASANSSVIFRKNIASVEGGGVYYESQFAQRGTLEPLDTIDCFVSSSIAYDAWDGDKMFGSNITVEFTDNEAPIGSMVFGSTLNSCSWAKSLNVSDKDLFLELHCNHSSTFMFSEVPNDTKSVSTQPYFISVPTYDRSISSCPGQMKNIEISVTDVFLNKIDTVLTSEIVEISDAEYHDVKLGPSGSWYYSRSDQSVPFLVSGDYDDNIVVSLYATSNLVSTDITVTVLHCFIGFVYNNEMKQCSCDSLIKEPITCDQREVQLTVPPLRWLGCEDSSNCSSTEDLILLECYFSLCNPQERVFNTSDPSSFCANDSHRSGIMCGQCADGYSMVFGADECWNCTNANPAVLLSLSAINGLASFLFVALLGIAIDKGLTYMVIFFCNVIFPYYVYDTGVLVKYMLIPSHFLAQETVFAQCFYDGLDSLAKVGFTFLYCGYLYTLMALFVILCRCSSFASRYFIPAKTLSALIFLTYNLIFSTCAEVLSALPVRTIAGTNKSIRWLVDPNVPYFQGWHAVLGAVSIILVVVYIIIFPLLLLSPSLAYKYGQRFKPFLDAIWAPFKPKYRIWAFLRIAVRVLVVVFSRFLVTQSMSGIIANFSILIIFLYAQSLVQPFNEKLVNVIDNLLTLIAVFMHIGAYMKLSQQWNIASWSLGEIIYVASLLTLAYFVIVATFVWYSRKAFRRFLNFFSKCCTKRRGVYDSLDTQTQQSIQSRPTHTSVSIVRDSKWMPPRRTFTRIRESLLEDESMHFIAH